MKLPVYVKSYPGFVKYIPILKQFGGNSIYPYIFLRHDIYNNLLSKEPSYWCIATLKHEEKHRENQIKQGWFIFGLKYLFSAHYRFNEELEAYKISMKIYKQYKKNFDIDKIAKAFSSSIYLWAKPYKEAKEILEKTWLTI